MANDIVLKNDGKNRYQSQECYIVIRPDGLENTFGEALFEIFGYDKSEILENIGKLQNALNKDLYHIRKKIEEEVKIEEKESRCSLDKTSKRLSYR